MEGSSQHTPWIKKVIPELVPPSLQDNTADVDRLLKGLKKTLGTQRVLLDFSLAKAVPHALRQYEYDVQATLFQDSEGWHLIGLEPRTADGSLYALAVDLGSSTVVLRLMDLITTETLEERSFHNPQIQIGTDILTRIHFAGQKGGLEKLRSLLIERLNQEIQSLADQKAIPVRAIMGMCAAGNTAMTHFFLGLDPYWICREPYIPAINKPDLIKAGELGLCIHPEAPVLVFPNVGSYLGGDLIAGVLACGMTKTEHIAFLVDVGTNAEVVIGNSDWLMGCAGAAGPALEGGVAGMGMMAAPGVIDKVEIDPHTLQFKIGTIEGKPPVGICGSGLIDLVAQLFLAGMIDLRGKFVAEKCGTRLVETDGVRQLVVVPPEASGTGEALTLSQPDIDALIRSKAAMYTILTTVAKTVNISFQEVSKFYVAGTFGAYIDPRSAIVLGMIPDLPLETYIPLGNSSIEGATMALLSAEAREEISRIRDQVTYLELNVNQEFMNLFSAAKFIPHTDRTLFPSVKGREE